MIRRLLLLLLMFALPDAALAQSAAQSIVNPFSFTGSTWAQTLQCPSSVPLAISSATTTQEVAAASGKSVYVCGFLATVAGTTPTVQFEYGTGASCGTGTTTLSGALAPTAGTSLGQYASLGYLFKTPASQALCVVSAGTSPSIQGVLYYAQF